MRILIDYIDNESILPEEAISNLQYLIGDSANVNVEPNSYTNVEDLLYFAIQKLISDKHIDGYLSTEDELEYSFVLEDLKDLVTKKVNDILSKVIEDNERRINDKH